MIITTLLTQPTTGSGLGWVDLCLFKQINLTHCAQASSRSKKHAQLFFFFTTNRSALALVIS